LPIQLYSFDSGLRLIPSVFWPQMDPVW